MLQDAPLVVFPLEYTQQLHLLVQAPFFTSLLCLCRTDNKRIDLGYIFTWHIYIYK